MHSSTILKFLAVLLLPFLFVVEAQWDNETPTRILEPHFQACLRPLSPSQDGLSAAHSGTPSASPSLACLPATAPRPTAMGTGTFAGGQVRVGSPSARRPGVQPGSGVCPGLTSSLCPESGTVNSKCRPCERWRERQEESFFPAF